MRVNVGVFSMMNEIWIYKFFQIYFNYYLHFAQGPNFLKLWL